jgi:hypothetical protein
MIDNWKEIISQLGKGVDITTDPSRWNLDTPGYKEIYQMWKDANFNMDSIKWTNYYPDKHFNSNIVNVYSTDFKIIHRAWISRLDPGYMAPLHWDVDDNEHEYLKHGPLKRKTIMMQDFALGQLFILGKEHYYNLLENSVIDWDKYNEWHSASNASMLPNYMLHIIGTVHD